MAAWRWLGIVLAAACAVASFNAAAQTPSQTPAPSNGSQAQRGSFTNPAEYDSYMAALNTKDPARRAQAMEVFIAWYPGSALRLDAHEQAISAWQAANQPGKADVLVARLLQVDPDNVRALANRAYVGQVKEQMAGVFNGVLGFAALQAKDYDKARDYYRQAVEADPANLQDVYQYAVAQLEGSPVDALGFWYGARSIAIARAAKNDPAAQDIDRYVRSRYSVYRGSEEGWDGIVSRVANETAPPANFKKSIPRAMTPPDRALEILEDNEPAKLTPAQWVLVLRHRDVSPANKRAAEAVWKALGDRQQGGQRLKLPFKVITATPERIEGAITDEAQAGDVVEVDVTMMRPLSPLPAVGSKIFMFGTLSDYRTQPFLFRLTRAELAPESLPVAGGPCADPRPQMCTKDYRPACGQLRDGTRKTYGNACTACSDPQVVTQGAGACP